MQKEPKALLFTCSTSLRKLLVLFELQISSCMFLIYFWVILCSQNMGAKPSKSWIMVWHFVAFILIWVDFFGLMLLPNYYFQLFASCSWEALESEDKMMLYEFLLPASPLVDVPVGDQCSGRVTTETCLSLLLYWCFPFLCLVEKHWGARRKKQL